MPQSQELAFASRALAAIEINGTFYRTQTPATFRKWARETPDDFLFSVKAPRYATAARELASAGPSVDRFMTSGLSELGSKLGLILWQFPATKRFDSADFARFLSVLPRDLDGRRVRHALEVRHASFDAADFFDLARQAGAAIVLADSDTYPRIERQTADFSYLRLMRAREAEPAGYAPAELDSWAQHARTAAQGGRDAFVFFTDGYKPKAPASALAFLQRIEGWHKEAG